MKVTNIAGGPRGLNTTTGAIVLDPGQTSPDVEVSEAELRVAKKTGWFQFDGAAKVEEAGEKADGLSFDNLSDDNLRVFLAERGVKADGRWARERLLDEARKVAG